MQSFGDYAKERIRRLGKNQKALAAKLGVSPAYISQICTGKKNPPDLSRPRNKLQLRVWASFLDVSEEEVLDLIRFQLHRVPPRPAPRYAAMRALLLSCLGRDQEALAHEIRSMELHPAENLAIQAMVQVYLILHEEISEDRAYGMERLRELCARARSDREFIEGELARFFGRLRFSWGWEPEGNDVRFSTEVAEVRRAIEVLASLSGHGTGFLFRRTVPVVGHVSAGEGFEFTDGGYPVGEGFEHVELPPGVDPGLARRLYCVRVRGNSLREFISEGSLLFIKPESWEEIRDGDLVIFKDRQERRAFVKKVEFSGASLILKSMNSMYKNIVLSRSDLILLERVMAVLF
jgi:phage repressor protein C with HTH and peptisase S24 domain/transcriptional regulator with XRE-family HTH domain